MLRMPVNRGREKILYAIDYLSKDEQTKKYTLEFTLHPIIQLNPQMGNVAEPSTKHFLNKDIYTHITYADPNSLKDENPGAQFTISRVNTVSVGDKMYSSRIQSS